MKFEAARTGSPTRRRPGRLLEQEAQHLDHLQPGQLGTQAEVRADAERDVGVRVPQQVQPMRIIEHRGIAVGGAEPDHDLVARPDLLVAQRGVAGGGASELLNGRHVAQQLVDGRREVLGVLGHPRPQVVLVQGEHRAGHGVARRLVAGDHQEEPEHLELRVAQSLAVDLGVDDPADDVVARMSPDGPPPSPGRRPSSRPGRSSRPRRAALHPDCRRRAWRCSTRR